MAIKKIIVNNVVNMDVSQDTVTENTLLNTYTAHKSDGTQITGTYVPSGGEELPTYTVTYTNGEYTVTCDKTYSEVATGYDGDCYPAAIVNYSGSGESYTYGVQLGYNDTELQEIIYPFGKPLDFFDWYIFDIVHTPNSLTCRTPSEWSLIQPYISITENESIDAVEYGIYLCKLDLSSALSPGTYTYSYKYMSELYEGLPLDINVLTSNWTEIISEGFVWNNENVTFTTSDTTVTISSTSLTITTTRSDIYHVTLRIRAMGIAGVSVNVPTSTPTLQSKTVSVTPTESAQTQTVSPDNGYDALSSVTVNTSAISSTYVGSNISRRSSTDLTVSGATVTAPAGYYSTSASKSVASGTVTAPSSISGTSATVTTGTNTLTLTKTVSVTPNVTTAGYVSSGTAGDSSVSLTAPVTINPTPTASGMTVTIPAGYYSSQTSKSVSSGSASAPSTISGTSATVSTGTNTLTLTKTVSVTPVVSAGYVSSGTATNSSVSLTASITTKAAATITPGTTSQTIAAGTYLTGTQTISGDANLVGSNILSGKSIFGVAGTVTFQTYYTGSSAPSSSQGVNGDIYLQT